MFASGAHLQAVRLLVRRRPREDRAEEPDAYRRTVDGRMEGLLLRVHVELAVEADEFRRPRYGVAGAASGAQAEAQVRGLRLVHAHDRAGNTDAAARRDLLRRGDEPEDGGVSVRNGRRLRRHHVHVLLPPSSAREPVLHRHASPPGASRSVRQGRHVHLLDPSCRLRQRSRQLDLECRQDVSRGGFYQSDNDNGKGREGRVLPHTGDEYQQGSLQGTDAPTHSMRGGIPSVALPVYVYV